MSGNCRVVALVDCHCIKQSAPTSVPLGFGVCGGRGSGVSWQSTAPRLGRCPARANTSLECAVLGTKHLCSVPMPRYCAAYKQMAGQRASSEPAAGPSVRILQDGHHLLFFLQASSMLQHGQANTPRLIAISATTLPITTHCSPNLLCNHSPPLPMTATPTYLMLAYLVTSLQDPSSHVDCPQP